MSIGIEFYEKWQGVTYIGDRKIVHQFTKKGLDHQVVIAQWLAWRLATGVKSRQVREFINF